MKHKIRKWNEAKKANDIVELNVTQTLAIHRFCANECMAGSAQGVKECTDRYCPLYIYRNGEATKKAKAQDRLLHRANESSDHSTAS